MRKVRAYTARELYALANPKTGERSWFAIKNKKAEDGPAQVMIYDEIGRFGIPATAFASDLAKIKGDIELHLNSPGGEVFDGIAIYNALKNHSAGIVQIVIDSLAASIASVIAMAADPGQLLIADSASLMMHDGFGVCLGNAADMRSLAEVLDKQSQNIAAIYAQRAGKDADHWRSLMQANGSDGTWWIGQEAVDAGLADFVVGEEPVRNQSAAYKKKKRQPPDDDDGEMYNDSVDDSPWDASKAWAAGSAADDSEAFFRGICAGHHTSGDPKTQAYWALPYRYSPSSAPNVHGVDAAWSAFQGGRGGVKDLANRDQVKAKLIRLKKQVHGSDWSPDSGPSDRADELAAMAVAMKEMK